MIQILLITSLSVGLQLLGILAFSWEILEVGGSKTTLGINLSLAAVIPYLLSKSIRIKNYIESNLKYYFRIVAIFSLVILLASMKYINMNAGVNNIIFISMAFSVASNLLVQGAEQAAFYMKINGSSTSKQVSKIINYGTQGGSIVFAVVFGITLKYFSISEVFVVSIFCIIIILLLTLNIEMKSNSNNNSSNKLCLSERPNILPSELLTYLFVLAIINSGTTIVLISIINDNNTFDSVTLGIADALAGLGALVGIYSSSKMVNSKLYLSSLFLMISLASLGLGGSELQIFASIFIWGLSLNYIRYRVKLRLAEHVVNSGHAVDISMFSINLTMLANGLTPVVVGFMLHYAQTYSVITFLCLISLTLLFYSRSETAHG